MTCAGKRFQSPLPGVRIRGRKDHISITVTIIPNTSRVTSTLTVTESEHNAGNNNVGFSIVNAADFNLTLSPSSLTVHPGAQGTTTLFIYPQQGGFNSRITFSCSGLPANATCTFPPASVTPGSETIPVMVTISVPQTSAQVSSPATRQSTLLLAIAWLPLGLILSPQGTKHIRYLILFLGVLICVAMGLQGCGGSRGGGNGTSGGTGGGSPTHVYSVNIIGNGSEDQHSSVLTLIVH